MLTAAVVLSALAPNATRAQQAPSPRLAFLHMSADAPALDVYVDGARVVDGLNFRESSPYLQIGAGSHAIQVSPAKRLDVLLSTSATFAAGSSYTWVLSGLLTASDVTVPLTPDLQFVRAIQLSDNAGTATDQRPRLRVVHASPGAGALDVRTDNAATPILATNLAYGNVSGYISVDAGAYALSLYFSGTNTLVASIPSVTLQSRTAYTLVLGGLLPSVVASSAPTTVQQFQPVVLTDQSAVRSAPLSRGCNQVVLNLPAGTPISSVLSRIDNTASVASIWRFDNAAKVLRAGYFADVTAPVDYSATVASPEAAFVCVTANTSWSPA